MLLILKSIPNNHIRNIRNHHYFPFFLILSSLDFKIFKNKNKISEEIAYFISSKNENAFLYEEIKDLEAQKVAIEQLFADGKVADESIAKKANELQNIINKIASKEERWFELSAKMEG